MSQTDAKNAQLAGIIARGHNRQHRMGCVSPWLWFKPCGSRHYRKPLPPAEGNLSVIGVPLHDREITACRAMAYIREYQGRGGWALGDAWEPSRRIGELLGGNLAALPSEGAVAWVAISPDRAESRAFRENPEDLRAGGWTVCPVERGAAVFIGELVSALNCLTE